MDRMVDGFGCKLLVEQDEPEGSADFLVEGSGSGEMPDTDESMIHKRMPANETDETVSKLTSSREHDNISAANRRN